MTALRERVGLEPPLQPTDPEVLRRTLGSVGLDKYVLLILPAMVLICVVFVYPVGIILLRAFTEHIGSQGGPLANIEWYLMSEVQRTILWRTYATAGMVTAICLVVCYPFAYVMTTLKKTWFAVSLGIVLVASGQSILVRTFSWKVLLRDNGPINDFLEEIGLGRVQLLGTTMGVVIAMCQVLAPFMILSLFATMRGIDRRLVDAARSLGASPGNAFLRVYLPLSLPGVVAGSLLVFVLSLGFYVTPAVVGSSQNSMLSQAIVNEISRKLDWGHAGAMAVTLLVSTLLLLGLLSLVLSRRLVIVAGRGVGK